MKAFKKFLVTVLAVGTIVLVPILILRFDVEIGATIPIIIGAFFALNLIIRNFKWSEKYFISPFNILTSKHNSKFKMDISVNLMHDKLLEVMKDSNFGIKATDKSKHEIFATTPISWRSLGENVYIQMIEEKGGSTTIKFTSVTFLLIALM